ncbi:MAG TPA: glycosyltransferase family 2 protein [Steroidobacteraceae bacterium]|nr:glycosyltransferase family 2 protein [Steroidobacteraceae bacterium]
MTRPPKLSIVIPAFNEAASLAQLHQELLAALREHEESYEIILVDDGSTDGTDRAMRELSAQDRHVRAFRLPRNQGKSAAYRVGFAHSRGDSIVTLDADLQDDPQEIPGLLRTLREQNLDLVIGWKQQRLQNEPGKALPSKAFNLALRMLFGLQLHDSNCGFRAMRADVAASLFLRGDYYRFIPQMAHLKGYRIAEHPVQHRRRRHGTSKYGWSRFFTGLLDAIALRFTVSFSEKPLHAFGALSLPFLATGGALELYVLMRKISGGAFADHLAALLTGVTMLIVGAQILSIGLVGVLLAAIRPQEDMTRTQPIRPEGSAATTADSTDAGRVDGNPA